VKLEKKEEQWIYKENITTELSTRIFEAGV